MSVRQLPSGTWQARLTIDGRNHAQTFATREEAKDWEILTRTLAINGSLPRRLTVQEYAVRWLSGYDGAPLNTRGFHDTNLKHIVRALGPRQLGDITPSDITRILNQIAADRTPALADRVYRTASAMFASAAADGLSHPDRRFVPQKHRHRRQREPKDVLERAEAKRVLAELTGWQQDTALVQLEHSAPASARSQA